MAPLKLDNAAVLAIYELYYSGQGAPALAQSVTKSAVSFAE